VQNIGSSGFWVLQCLTVANFHNVSWNVRLNVRWFPPLFSDSRWSACLREVEVVSSLMGHSTVG
jgi:hypothetical protein